MTMNELLSPLVMSMAAMAGGTLALLSGFFVYMHDRRHEGRRAFITLASVVGAWGILLGVIFAPNITAPMLLTVTAYLAAAAIPPALFVFSSAVITEGRVWSALHVRAALVPFLGAAALLTILGARAVPDLPSYELISGLWRYAATIYVGAYLAASIVVLFEKYRTRVGVFRRKTGMIFWVTTLFLGTTEATAVFLAPDLWAAFYWVLALATGIGIAALGFALSRGGFLGGRLYLTELFTGAAIIILFVEALTAQTLFAASITTLILVLFAGTGVSLIRTVREEIRAREDMEHLLEDLAQAHESLEALDKKKSEFISVASHHLRDPLTVIKGYSSMLLENSFGELHSSLREAVGRIFRSSERLIAIVDDFLDTARIESGDMPYEWSLVDVRAMLEDLVAEFRPIADHADVRIAFASSGNDPLIARADAGKIRQMFSNLVDNAITYNVKRGSVSVAVRRIPGGNGDVILATFTDTGIGIRAEDLDRIFEKFGRGEGVSKVYTEGSGLGLYVAREILRRHGGRIWGESQGLGKGATFYVEIPVTTTAQEAPTGSASDQVA